MILSTPAAVNVELVGGRAFFDIVVDRLVFKSWAKVEASRNDELRA
jgi:hypothetical protein